MASVKMFRGVPRSSSKIAKFWSYQGLLPKHAAEPEYDRPAYAWRPARWDGECEPIQILRGTSSKRS